jgi:hypothetical protein
MIWSIAFEDQSPGLYHHDGMGFPEVGETPRHDRFKRFDIEI